MISIKSKIGASSIAVLSSIIISSPIHNDRKFYEDEPESVESATPVPVQLAPSLENGFKLIRQSLYNSYTSTVGVVDKGYNRYYDIERRVADTASQLHDKSEDLFPNSIYIFITALSGTIMARQRNVLAKLTFPVILGIGSFKYFLPQTFASTTNFVWKLEQQKVPEIAKQQENLVLKSEELMGKIEKTRESSLETVNSGLEWLRRNIQKYTGLNLDDDVTKK